MPTRVAALLTCLLLAPAMAAARAEFTDTERAAILRHGPWPPVQHDDSSNRASGDEAAITLGKALFFDARLSSSDSASCATCHDPALAFTDGRATAQGTEALARNTPTLVNVRFNRWFGWDGANDNLWGQSLRPISSPREMDFTLTGVANLIAGDGRLSRLFKRAYGLAFSDVDTESVFVLAGKALAAYQETLVSPRTTFDDFRDALAAGNRTSAYPAAAQRGLKLFVGKGRCNLCHFGPLFSNGEFADTGISYFVADGGVDSGRYGGIQALLSSPYNRLGRFSDDTSASATVSTRHVRLTHRNWGEFRVPSLRNAALTAPYMHNGGQASLEDVIEHYSELDEERLHVHGERLLRPLRLDAGQRRDLLAFLVSLSQPADDARAR